MKNYEVQVKIFPPEGEFSYTHKTKAEDCYEAKRKAINSVNSRSNKEASVFANKLKDYGINVDECAIKCTEIEYGTKLKHHLNDTINDGGLGYTNHLNDLFVSEEVKERFDNHIQSSVNGMLHQAEQFVSNPLLIDMKETFDSCYEIAVRKNSDYGGSNTNPFNNFKNSLTVGVPIEKGIMVRMMDKVSRISTLLEKEAMVSDESINDTLDDLINYTAILKSYLKRKNEL
jgi:hypothetical protein